MSLVKHVKGRRLIDEAREALAEQAADERAKNPVWKRRKGEEDGDMILVSDKKPGSGEIVVRETRATFAIQQAVLGARLAPVYFPRAQLERMAKAGVERAVWALEEDRHQRAGRAAAKSEVIVLKDPRKRYRFAVGIMKYRRVTVMARTEAEARIKASGVLDKRAAKAGAEPPMAWDLRLLEIS